MLGAPAVPSVRRAGGIHERSSSRERSERCRRNHHRESAGQRLEPRRAGGDSGSGRVLRTRWRRGGDRADRRRANFHCRSRHQGVRKDHVRPETARPGADSCDRCTGRFCEADRGRDSRNRVWRRPGSCPGLPLPGRVAFRPSGPARGEAGDHSGGARHAAPTAHRRLAKSLGNVRHRRSDLCYGRPRARHRRRTRRR